MNELGQLFITGIKGLSLDSEEIEFIQNENIGGVILFSRNYNDPAQNHVRHRHPRARRTRDVAVANRPASPDRWTH